MSVQTPQVTQPVTQPRPRTRRIFGEDAGIAYLFIAPALLLIAVIAFFPVVQAVWYSLTNYIPTYPQYGSSFVGLDNYFGAHGVFNDPTFRDSIKYTIIFTVVSVTLELILGLLFALVLNQKFPGRGIARAAVLVPWAFPTVISAVVWRDLLWQNNSGAIPAILHFFGFVPADWAPLASTNTLMTAMVIIDVWKTAPFMALLLLAGLQVISDDVYEAGRVDGANAWQRFWFITLPLLKPAILVALLFRILDAWRVFDMFYVVAGSRLQSMSVFAYNQVVVSDINFPVGVAGSTVIFIGALIIALVFIKGLGTQTAA
jgi:trehalose/maltose transport system permease protein